MARSENTREVQEGFTGVQLATQTSSDELIRRTSEANDHINIPLGKKPENGAKIAIDDIRIAADRAASSAIEAAKRVDDLLNGKRSGHLWANGSEFHRQPKCWHKER